MSWGPSVDTASVNAPGPTAVSVSRSSGRLPERGEGLVDRLRAPGQLRPGRELAERPESGLLAARPVQGADAPRLERQGEQAVELVRLTALDRVPAGEHDEEVVEEVTVVALVEHVAHGLDLGACDLELVVLQQHGRHACASSPRIAWSSCSNPPVSIEQCIPHSLGAPVSHHQRPARVGSPGAIARVQGLQPIDVYPLA